MKKSLFADVNLREVRGLVGELRPDDGVDPREEAKRRNLNRRPGRPGQSHCQHKQEQLFHQVQMAIEAALHAAATPILNCLMVREVTQQGGSLAVIVSPEPDAGPVDLGEVSAALEQASSMLRREVAEAITRKETPHLTFVVLPADAEKLEE